MVKVRLRPTAESDFLAVGHYTRDQWSEDQAEVYLRRLLQVIEQIEDHPLSGQDVGGIRLGYRRRRAGHHLVFYVIMPDGSVEIARILHEKTDTSRHLDEN